MFKRFLRLCLALAAATTFGSAIAADLPKPIADAAPHLNAFASGGTTVNGPLGGTFTVDTSGWAGTSGTLNITYNSFKIAVAGQTWTYNGSWAFTGSMLSNGYLDGTLTGSWNISGIDLASMGVSAGSTLSLGFNIQFKNGMANGTINISMPGLSTPIAYPVSFSQSTALGLLL